MVAGAHVFLYRTAGDASRQCFTREDVIEPPADVPLAHVAPWRPPREEAVVVGIDGATDVDEAVRQDALDDRALFGQLADCARLALLRVHITFGARDIHV